MGKWKREEIVEKKREKREGRCVNSPLRMLERGISEKELAMLFNYTPLKQVGGIGGDSGSL